MNKEKLSNEFKERKESISFETHYDGLKTVEFLRLPVYTEDNPIVIENYPYGFNYRTDIRYWIETTNRGDRFCSQTLNPRTKEWNKPKKTTYSDIMILIANSQGHITYLSCSMNSKKEKAKAFLKTFEKELSQIQRVRLHKVIGWDKAMENVTFSVKARRFKHKETGEITESMNVFELK